MSVDFDVRGQIGDELFHLRKHYGLWTVTRSNGLKLKCFVYGFVSYKHASLLHKM